MAGWVALTESTPHEVIPIHCRVHVTIRPSTTTAPASTTQSATTRLGEDTLANGASTNEQHDADFSRHVGSASSSVGESVKPEELLALPWRRFELEEVSGQGGLEVCGRRVIVGEVSNSAQGTGLFTWVSLFLSFPSCVCVCFLAAAAAAKAGRHLVLVC